MRMPQQSLIEVSEEKKGESDNEGRLLAPILYQWWVDCWDQTGKTWRCPKSTKKLLLNIYAGLCRKYLEERCWENEERWQSQACCKCRWRNHWNFEHTFSVVIHGPLTLPIFLPHSSTADSGEEALQQRWLRQLSKSKREEQRTSEDWSWGKECFCVKIVQQDWIQRIWPSWTWNHKGRWVWRSDSTKERPLVVFFQQFMIPERVTKSTTDEGVVGLGFPIREVWQTRIQFTMYAHFYVSITCFRPFFPRSITLGARAERDG